MRKQKSLAENVIYNFIYTGFNFLFPIITSPYVSRVLGASNLGKVNFASTIINWFILFASVGIPTYGIREIAKVRDDQKKLNRTFTQLFLIISLTTLIVTVVYFWMIYNFDFFEKERTLFLIISLNLIFNLFGLDWFYQGIEEYQYITIRSFIMKLISLIGIFMFVKSSDDYLIYAFISVLATGFSSVLNLFYSRNFVSLDFDSFNVSKHIKPLSIFLMHNLVVGLYTGTDQLFLGIFDSSSSVAYMNKSKSVTSVAISFSNSISNATLSRSSYYIKNDKQNFDKLIEIIPNLIMWITIPVSVGVFMLADEVMLILGGPEFSEAAIILRIIAPTIVLIPLSTYIQNQILIPIGSERIGLGVSFLSGISSVILNLFLIPRYSYIGAAVTNLFSEILSIFLRYIIVKNEFKNNGNNFSLFNKSNFKYFFFSFMMVVGIIFLKHKIENPVLLILASAIGGALIYVLGLLLTKEKYTLIIFDSIYKRIRK